jgi:hypothetical protein
VRRSLSKNGKESKEVRGLRCCSEKLKCARVSPEQFASTRKECSESIMKKHVLKWKIRGQEAYPRKSWDNTRTLIQSSMHLMENRGVWSAKGRQIILFGINYCFCMENSMLWCSRH